MKMKMRTVISDKSWGIQTSITVIIFFLLLTLVICGKILCKELYFQESSSQTSSHSCVLFNDPCLTAPPGYFYLSQICPRMHCPTFSQIPKVFIFSDSNRTDGPEELNRPPETYFIKTGRSVIVHQLCDLCSKNDIIVMIVTAWTF